MLLKILINNFIFFFFLVQHILRIGTSILVFSGMYECFQKKKVYYKYDILHTMYLILT
jgi:hypothetical protein